MDIQCSECVGIFARIGAGLAAPISSEEFLNLIPRTLVEQLHVKATLIRLLSRDRKTLDLVASWGLSNEYLDKGPVDAERSVVEALDGRIVMIPDVSRDARIQYPEACAKEGIVSALTVPLQSRGQVLGVLRLFTDERREFTSRELEVIRAVADFCSSGIVHSMFHSILAHVSETIRSTLDLDGVLATIVRVVTKDLYAKGCTIRLVEGTNGHIELRAAYGMSDDYLRATGESHGEGLAKALRGECVAILDAASDARVQHHDEAVREGVSSILFVPLVVRSVTVGVLSLYTQRPYQFSADELDLMNAIAEQSALAIRNAQMYTAVKKRYDDLANDFQRWFEHTTYSTDV